MAATPAPRLLIVNCASPYFFYIPMGCFGLCDFLRQQGIEAQIFSPSLYPETEARQRLHAALDDFQPTHVGLVCHWQETAHGLVSALEMIKNWNPAVVALSGGFTASYFAESLLEHLAQLDYVVIGDPEEPVAQLLLGRPPAEIANLAWREHGRVRRSERLWLMEQPLFDALCFADLSPLIDAERYIDKINAKLGFPLLIGRGCVFDCAYCGGSRHAFRLHSGRCKPVARSIPAILADLRLLKARTTLLYLCYENDFTLIKRLFRAIADDPELCGHFTLHYGAWRLLDAEFLELYRRAFNCASDRPIIEFSPETASDPIRAAIKRGSTYSLEEMEENFREISEAFQGRVRIEVFFSRYHPAMPAQELEPELIAILRFKHKMASLGLPAHICFDHLSTDVGSRYWEDNNEHPHDFARFLALKTQVDQGSLHPFPVDNLCLRIPEHFDPALLIRFEALVLTLEILERHCRELVHVLLACLDDQWLEPLQAVLAPLLDAQPAAFFAEPPLEAIIDNLGRRLQAASGTPPFLPDLLRFSCKKLEQGVQPLAARPASSSHPSDHFVLNFDRLSIHQHNYLDLPPLLRKLREHSNAPPYQRTAVLFLRAGILTLPHAVYRRTLQAFERPLSLANYRASLADPDAQQQQPLLERLIMEGMLLPIACREPAS